MASQVQPPPAAKPPLPTGPVPPVLLLGLPAVLVPARLLVPALEGAEPPCPVEVVPASPSPPSERLSSNFPPQAVAQANGTNSQLTRTRRIPKRVARSAA